MKKIISGAALAILTMLSACENIELQENDIQSVTSSGVAGGSSSEQVLFTATLGADTKVYLEYDSSEGVYKTLWHENDQIIVYDKETGECERCQLVEGAGTSTAVFAGSIKADEYVAFYGNAGINYEDFYEVYFSSYQYGANLFENSGSVEYEMYYNLFPMMAESTSNTFNFKNLASVLKISLTGDEEYVNSVQLRSNNDDVYMSGQFAVDVTDYTLSYKDSGENYLEFGLWYTVSSIPIEFYIVLPPQTYTDGFTLDFYTDDETISVEVTEDIEMKRSHIRNLDIDLSPEEAPVWYMETTTGGNSWSSCQMSYKEGMCVVEDFYVDMNTSAYIRFQDINGIYYGCSSQYRENRYKTNTCISLVSGDSWYCFNLSLPGYYDIYLDPASGCVFLMSDGYTPDDLPTKEVVVYEYYNDIYNYALVDSYVMIHGPVLAKCNYGFIVAIDGYYYNNIYVYDPSNLCDVELGDWVDVCAKRADYRNLPELKITEGDYFCQVIYSSNMNYDSEPANRITDYATYSSSSYSYEYISYEGTLEISGIYNNIIFDGVEGYKGSITKQGTDLSEFNGKKVYVEGYYAGSNTSNGVTYINIILKKIMLYNEDTVGGGTTEEILPGDSFPVSNPVLRR